MERVVSGIRPTGHLHLGNYFGAVRNFVRMQEQEECFFFVADYHSLTTHPSPEELHQNVKQTLIEYLACGVDPEKATIYIQSDLPETLELYTILNMIAYKGRLERATTFKEKVRKQPDNINAGLLTYPVLMAADILIHKASKVPVGEDQKQHLEMTRDYAKRFNYLSNTELFPQPQAYNFGEALIRVPGLDGSGKMSKSQGPRNAIFLSDSPEAIEKKVMSAVTDAGPTEKNQTKPPEIQNIFDLMHLVSDKSTWEYFNEQYNSCNIRYGDMKKQLAKDMEDFVAPFREKIKAIAADEKYIKSVARQGAEKSIESGRATVQAAKEAFGIKSLF